MANDSSAIVTVSTNGVWRARQVVQALDAIDGLIIRIATASMLAEICQANDYVISNLRVLGLLKRGEPSKWEQATGGMADVARTDYVEFVRLMRLYGVEVKQTPVTLEFSFLVTDVLDIVPESARLEVAQLSMASPGRWILTMSGNLAKKTLLAPLQMLFDGLFFRPETREIKRAQAKVIEAAAKKTEAEADYIKAQTAMVQAKAALGLARAFETPDAALRNAGFRLVDTRAAVFDPAHKNLNVLTTLKASGLLRDVSLEVNDPDSTKDKKNANG